MSCWIKLGIEPTADATLIRNAYRSQLPTHHPETDPEGFQALRLAYENALRLAREPQYDAPLSAPPARHNISLEAFHNLLEEPAQRFDPAAWRAFCAQLDQLPLEALDQLNEPLLRSLLDCGPLSHACAKLLVQRMAWPSRLLQMDPVQAREADAFFQRLERPDPFDLALLGAWPAAAQWETLWYSRTLENLYHNRELGEFRSFVSQHSVLPLPPDSAFIDRLVQYCSLAGIGWPSFHALCTERHREAPDNLDWLYLLACQSSALGLEQQAFEQWLQLWERDCHPQAATWLLQWCQRHARARLPLLIQAFDQPGYAKDWPDQLDDMLDLGDPAQTPQTLGRWHSARQAGLDGIAAAYVTWRLHDDELPLVLHLLDDSTAPGLSQLYRIAWNLQRGDAAALRQLLAHPPAAEGLDRLILLSLQQQARQRLDWQGQAPAVRALRAFLSKDEEHAQPPVALLADGPARQQVQLWLQRLRHYDQRSLERLAQLFASNQRNELPPPLPHLLHLAGDGLTLPAPAEGDQAQWHWQSQTLLMLALLDQPQRALRLLQTHPLDSLPAIAQHPFTPLLNLLQHLQQQQCELITLLGWLDSKDPLQQLLALRLTAPQHLLASVRLPSAEQLYICCAENLETLDPDPMGLLLLYAVLYHDPQLNAQQHGQALQGIAGFTSAALWFEDFRNGLIKGKSVRLSPSDMAQLGVPAKAYEQALITLSELVQYGRHGVPRTAQLRLLQKAKDDPDTPLALRLAISGILAWCERLLLAGIDEAPVSQWRIWRLGSRLDRGNFALQSLGWMVLSGFLLFEANLPFAGLAALVGGLLSCMLRRLHDIGRGVGSLVLLALLSIALPFASLCLFLLPGEHLPNRYGMPCGKSRRQALAGGLQELLRKIGRW